MSRRKTATALLVMATSLLAIPGAARADVGTFSNPTSITLPDLGQGSPYQSNINVSGLTGVVSDVNASIVSLDYSPNVNDVEVLLVSPDGKSTVLIGDAGGNVVSVNDTLNFDDSATLVAPESGGFVGGVTYRPADYQMPGLDPFNDPAPDPPYGLTLANLNGGNPSGTWSLYTFADVFNGGGGGDISGGWTLTVTTRQLPVCRGLTSTIEGTEGDDALTGTAGADVVAALGGDDTITGLGGNDIVCGGAGKDKASGGAGKDTLSGEAGKDTLLGGGAKDRLIGGAGKDVLKGGKGKDILKGGPGKDKQTQ